MKKIILATMSALLISAAVLADQPMTPGAFVNIGMARAESIGGAFTAIADDAEAIFYNPAGLVNDPYKEFTFMYAKDRDIVPYNYSALVYPINEYNAAGLGVIVSGDTLFDEKTILLSYAEKFDWLLGRFGIKGLCLGGSLKFQFAGYGNNTDPSPGSVQGSAGGMGLDLGMLFPISPEIQVGAFVQDALSALWWSSNWEGQTTNYVQGVGLTTDMGARYKIKDFMASMTLSDLDTLKFGIEKNIFGYIDIRGGYTQTLDFESYKQYALGVGIGHFDFGQRKEFSMSLDAAYLFQRLDDTLEISWSLKYK
jgi:hypothetical protein